MRVFLRSRDFDQMLCDLLSRFSVTPISWKVSASASKMEPFPHTVTCHCGDLRGSFGYSDATIKVWDCNCSDCSMRGNAHFIIPGDAFQLEGSDEEYRAKTILYLWGTKTAQRRFCKRCGILPWYVPRSNPDGIAITFACVNFAEGNTPKVDKCHYDGINWEKSRAESGISKESKENY